MNLLAASLLLSILCYLDISHIKSQSMSLDDFWSKKFTFRFIELPIYNRSTIRVTPKTERTTLISIPCLNIHRQLITYENQSLLVRECNTIEIFSTADITVHGMVFSSIGLVAGFLALPHDELGTEYLIDCYTPRGNSAQVAISAVSDNTTVTVHCVNDCHFINRTLSGSIELGAGESGILINSVNGTEVTGSYLRSNKPISVIVGSANVHIPMEHKGRGVILEQLLPISSWGLVHIVPPFHELPNGWIVRILAINASTNISTTGCGENASNSITMHSKEYRDITVNGESTTLCVVEANRPIQVMQYIASSEDGEYGDPSMTVIPPVIDYHGNTSLRVMGATETTRYFADVIVAAQQKELFLIDGSSVSESNWSCINITSRPTGASESAMADESFCHYATELQNGTHHMMHLQPAATFWVRLYTLHMTVGAAMLADIGLSVTTQSPIQRAIDEMLNEIVTVDNIDSISDELANVTEESSAFDEEDLQSITDELSAIVAFASEQNLPAEVVVQVSESVLRAVDNLLNIPESTFQTSSSQRVSRNILKTINLLTEVIQNTSTNNFTFSGSNIVLAAVKIDRRKFPLNIRSTIGGARDDVIDFSANEAATFNEADLTSVLLQQAILPLVPGSNQAISVSVFLMNSPKLFQKDKSSPSSTPSSIRKQNGQPAPMSVVASPILSVTVEGADIKDLPLKESIVFVFPVNQSVIEKDNNTTITSRCVYWDIDLWEWSDEGCRTENADLEGLVSCRCNHLTSFAVLLVYICS